MAIPPVFPSLPGITFPVKRSSKWAVTKHDALSGKRVRTSYYTYPVYMYDLAFNFLRSNQAFVEWQSLAGFINRMTGGTGLFVYSDPNDNYSGMNEVFGTGDGFATTFRLVRSLGGFAEPVSFPNLPILVRVGGFETLAYQVALSGHIVFNAPPGAGQTLDWTGNFYWPCRFDNDPFDIENFASQLFEMKSLKFSTEKLDGIAQPLLAPNANPFVLDVSLLGGPDVLE